jgi:hypothetical protein
LTIGISPNSNICSATSSIESGKANYRLGENNFRPHLAKKYCVKYIKNSKFNSTKKPIIKCASI